MPVVYVTRYTIQTSKDASKFIQSVVEKLLFFFVRLEIRIFLQKAYKSAFLVRFWCFSDLTHMPLAEFLGCMVTLEMTGMQPDS